MYQSVLVIGHVGKDPEFKNLASGQAVANFSVAASERWKDKESGEQKERTEWFNCAAWGRLGEVIQEYVHKGDKIMVQGRMQTRTYEKEGQTHYATTLVVTEMKMLGSKGEGGQKSEPSRSSARQAQDARGTAAPKQDEDFDDDIPF